MTNWTRFLRSRNLTAQTFQALPDTRRLRLHKEWLAQRVEDPWLRRIWRAFCWIVAGFIVTGILRSQ